MKETPKYSVIVPVYNRPEEIRELLESLTRQIFTDFEVLIVEDGSSVSSEEIVKYYSDKLAIHYFFKSNSGPGPSRNFGFEKASGKYFVVFDSDCIVPLSYFSAVEDFLKVNIVDAWGGPDRGHESFTLLQQAMAHTMSSFLTTGGIRGGKRQLDNYQPRSFNMGLSRSTYEKTKGFHFDRLAEDIELSVRMKKLGLSVYLIPQAFVFHKRRSTLTAFFEQVLNFGRGRVLVGRQHPGEVKWVHWFPAFFTMGLFVMPILFFLFPLFGWLMLFGYVVFLFLVTLEGYVKSKSILVALLSLPASLVQLIGYGFGFLSQKIQNLTQ